MTEALEFHNYVTEGSEGLDSSAMGFYTLELTVVLSFIKGLRVCCVRHVLFHVKGEDGCPIVSEVRVFAECLIVLSPSSMDCWGSVVS